MTSFQDKVAFVQKFAPKGNDKIQKILKLSANIDSPKLNDTQREQIKKALNTAYDKLKELKQESAAKKTPKTPRQTTKKGKKTASVDDSQKVLNDFKKSVGTALYKKATSRTTIRKDKEIPALKEGKRYPKAGKTTNQYGTFKNNTKRPYWESRANRMDVNQPSKSKYPKLAKGGQFADGGSVANQFYFYDYDGNAITFRDFEQARLEAKERGIQKFRDNLGGEYFVNYGKGGEFDGDQSDGYKSKKLLNYEFKRIIQAPKSTNMYEASPDSILGKVVSVKLPSEQKIFKTKVSAEYATMFKGSGKYNKLYEKQNIVSIFAKGGMTMQAIANKYEKNEDENAHSENVVLLAKHFGTAEELKEAKAILKKHLEEGSLSSENGAKRRELSLRLIEKARAEMKKEGVQFAKGGQISKGDSVHVLAENKSGIVTNIIADGKHYSVRFVDGSKNVYDKDELKRILSEEDYDEFADGGEVENQFKKSKDKFHSYPSKMYDKPIGMTVFRLDVDEDDEDVEDEFFTLQDALKAREDDYQGIRYVTYFDTNKPPFVYEFGFVNFEGKMIPTWQKGFKLTPKKSKFADGGTLAKAERDAKRLSKTYGKIYVLKREAGGEEGKYVTATEEDLFEELNSPYKSTFVSFFGKGKKYGDGGQTINLGSGEMTLDEAIDMYEKKIKAQGNVSNERDENMLRQLKQMKKMADGGKMEDCGCDEYADGGMFDENELQQARKATGKLKL